MKLAKSGIARLVVLSLVVTTAIVSASVLVEPKAEAEDNPIEHDYNGSVVPLLQTQYCDGDHKKDETTEDNYDNCLAMQNYYDDINDYINLMNAATVGDQEDALNEQLDQMNELYGKAGITLNEQKHVQPKAEMTADQRDTENSAVALANYTANEKLLDIHVDLVPSYTSLTNLLTDVYDMQVQKYDLPELLKAQGYNFSEQTMFTDCDNAKIYNCSDIFSDLLLNGKRANEFKFSTSGQPLDDAHQKAAAKKMYEQLTQIESQRIKTQFGITDEMMQVEHFE